MSTCNCGSCGDCWAFEGGKKYINYTKEEKDAIRASEKESESERIESQRIRKLVEEMLKMRNSELDRNEVDNLDVDFTSLLNENFFNRYSSFYQEVSEEASTVIMSHFTIFGDAGSRGQIWDLVLKGDGKKWALLRKPEDYHLKSTREPDLPSSAERRLRWLDSALSRFVREIETHKLLKDCVSSMPRRDCLSLGHEISQMHASRANSREVESGETVKLSICSDHLIEEARKLGVTIEHQPGPNVEVIISGGKVYELGDSHRVELFRNSKRYYLGRPIFYVVLGGKRISWRQGDNDIVCTDGCFEWSYKPFCWCS